jgi:hypothetical protein|tara:strand:- start:3579 stop:3788 length:210 start_codon:yes stop_codon:yes gene_type:complete
MSILKKLESGDSTLTGLNGSSPTPTDQQISKLHFDYSLDGKPYVKGEPQPTQLAGEVREGGKYMNNLPS